MGELLNLKLAEDILLLFFKRGRVGADVSEPLVPLGCKDILLAYLDEFTVHYVASFRTLTSHLHVRIVGFGVVLDDPSESPGIQ
jgi:hypothetical protein